MSDDWIEIDPTFIKYVPRRGSEDESRRSALARRKLEALRDHQWLHRQLNEVWTESIRT